MNFPPNNWLVKAKIYNKNYKDISYEWLVQNADVVILLFTLKGVDRDAVIHKFYNIYENVKQVNVPIEVINIPMDDTKSDMMSNFEEQANWFTLMFDDPLIFILKYMYEITCIPHILVLKPDGTIVSKHAIDDLEFYGKNAIVTWLSTSASSKTNRKLKRETIIYGDTWRYMDQDKNEDRRDPAEKRRDYLEKKKQYSVKRREIEERRKKEQADKEKEIIPPPSTMVTVLEEPMKDIKDTKPLEKRRVTLHDTRRPSIKSQPVEDNKIPEPDDVVKDQLSEPEATSGKIKTEESHPEEEENRNDKKEGERSPEKGDVGESQPVPRKERRVTIMEDKIDQPEMEERKSDEELRVEEDKKEEENEPTAETTAEPTAESIAEPTAEPTAQPTAEPTPEPTAEPTAEPTPEPIAEPTAEEDA